MVCTDVGGCAETMYTALGNSSLHVGCLWPGVGYGYAATLSPSNLSQPPDFDTSTLLFCLNDPEVHEKHRLWGVESKLALQVHT